jgi:hypothetical protein
MRSTNPTCDHSCFSDHPAGVGCAPFRAHTCGVANNPGGAARPGTNSNRGSTVCAVPSPTAEFRWVVRLAGLAPNAPSLAMWTTVPGRGFAAVRSMFRPRKLLEYPVFPTCAAHRIAKIPFTGEDSRFSCNPHRSLGSWASRDHGQPTGTRTSRTRFLLESFAKFQQKPGSCGGGCHELSPGLARRGLGAGWRRRPTRRELRRPTPTSARHQPRSWPCPRVLTVDRARARLTGEKVQFP